MFLGSHITPLVFVEVTPRAEESSTAIKSKVSVCNAFVKKQLMNKNQGLWTVSKWKATDASSSSPKISSAVIGIVNLPSMHPLCTEPWPFLVVGYGFPLDNNQLQCIVTDSTLVRILPQHEHPCTNFGQLPSQPLHPNLIDDVRQNHDELSLKTLRLRIDALLATPLFVGTTHDAFQIQKRKRQQSHVMRQNINLYLSRGNDKIIADDAQPPMMQRPKLQGALTVHSPNHGAGKTLLVRIIAQELGCRVHVVEAATLLAQYGVHADAALESLVHSIVTSAAVRGERLCIVLDHLQAFGPMGKVPDASLPILVSMSSYLFTLTKAMQQRQQVPFPSMNPLYNLSGTNGRILSLNMCIVGIVTCPDGHVVKGWSQPDALSMLQGTRYRLPDLSTDGRIRSLTQQLADLPLTQDAKQRLPGIVASRVGLYGRDFGRIRHHLMQQASSKEISAEDLVIAVTKVQPTKLAQYEVIVRSNRTTDNQDLFSSVGGNMDAKLALQDALAIDPKKRLILRTFGMSPPTGVLLYGPPGTGKTLLARAVAALLANTDTGGAFFSLQASDIVRSEVGNSEKELVTAFATARANAPAVIFIDEFQALFTQRSSSGSSGQLASTLLHCMDDISRWEHSDELSENESLRIVVMGATNTPWMIDKAFLRSGRFDKVVHVGLPNTEERKSILDVHIRRMRLKNATSSERLDLCIHLSHQTDGFSGADLAALCRLAAIRCLRDYGDEGLVEERHFFEALQSDIAPTSNETFVDRLKKWTP